MALSDSNFEALREQLKQKKEKLGDTEYQGFLERSVQSTEPQPEEETEGVRPTFEASPTDTPLAAGAKAVGNVPSSAFGLGKNIFQAVTNPIDTAKGVGRAITGGGRELQRIISGGAQSLTGKDILPVSKETTPSDITFNALQDSLIERFGSLEAAQKTATEDPVGFGADVVGIFTAASKLPAVSRAVDVVSDVNKAALDTIKTPLATKLDDAAIGNVQKAINLNPTDIRRIKQPNMAGQDPAEWLLRRDFKGSQEGIVTQLDDYRTLTKSQVDDGLEALQGTVKSVDAPSANKTLKVLRETFEGTVGNEELVARIDDFIAKDEFTMSELNEVKRLAQAELDVFKATGVLKDSAKAKGLNNVISELKTLIEDEAAKQGFDAVKQLNKETQVATEISKSMQKRLDVESKLPGLGLRDGILAMGGLATGGPLAAAGIVISKKVLESASFRTHLANKLKDTTPAQKAELQAALDSGNSTKVIEFLAPIVNEFETSQEQTQ